MTEFILMLTRNDVTVPDAAEVLTAALATDVAHIGFKDVGLPEPELRALVERIHAAGRQAHLEVVSLTEQDELRSARMAVSLGVDYLLGGTRWDAVSRLISGSGLKYFPYVGQVSGHPGQLGGSPEEILDDVAQLREAVDGVNLLAFRHTSLDGEELLRAVTAEAGLPVICAGTVDSLERVRRVASAGAWAFTIGAAALDGLLVPGQPLPVQLTGTLAAAQGDPASHAVGR